VCAGLRGLGLRKRLRELGRFEEKLRAELVEKVNDGNGDGFKVVQRDAKKFQVIAGRLQGDCDCWAIARGLHANY
jgi:hypothetical protein